jgi:hypothetical protein
MGQAVSTYIPKDGGKSFQLFGFDVMLSAGDLRPWVLEVNLDPSLATDAPLDLRVKGAVLTDLLNLLGVGASGDEDSEDGAREEDTTVSEEEAEVIRRVDAEGRRARKTGWRRLHPSKISKQGRYAQYFDSGRVRLHTLPFAGCGD